MKHYKNLSKTLLLSACAGLALGACAPVNLLNAITPSSSFTKASDVSYGALPRQSLDIYKADNPKTDAPILVYTHGGSWDSGSKDIYKFFAEGFTREGYTVAVPNYRLYPEARFPDMIVDTTKAIKFVADRYPDRPLVVMGHSAGAYNTLMAVMDPQFADSAGLKMCERIAGVIGMAPPTGIIPLKEEPYITIFPDRFTGKDAPLNQTEHSIPPLLLVHGLDDKTVYPQNSQKLAELVNARGGQAVVKTYADINHTDVIKVISKHFDGDASIKADMVAFIDGLDLSQSNHCE
ncbi:alpha/beta hydrolase [Fretibacter rubidus]|uniref:alpha/beta hydrolase n=1 Tax=Fretibacter rubidus TaxID=570162 RepID=UPI00352A346B